MTGRMTRQAFREWMEGRTDDKRFERVAGEPVMMAPERVVHARLKGNVWAALRDGIRRKGLPCEALPDGITVEVDDDTDYEPDAVVNCGPPLPHDAVAASNPVVVVEVLSPGTRHIDTGAKLVDYFRVPAVVHYLVVRAAPRAVIHHRRLDDGTILTRIATAGTLDLDPPGLTLDLDAVFDLPVA